MGCSSLMAHVMLIYIKQIKSPYLAINVYQKKSRYSLIGQTQMRQWKLINFTPVAATIAVCQKLPDACSVAIACSVPPFLRFIFFCFWLHHSPFFSFL